MDDNSKPRTFGGAQLQAWRAGDAILVFRGPHRDVVPTAPRRADGRPVGVTGEFWLVRAGGVERKFKAQTWSIEDELGCDLPAISDSALYLLHLNARGPHLTITDELLVSELRPIAASEALGLDDVLAAFEQDAKAQREAEARRSAEGAARVAKVEGASAPLEEASLESARQSLVQRLAVWHEPLCETLLEVLMAITRLEPRARVAWIAEPFALACRHAAYDRSAPQKPALSAVPLGAPTLVSPALLRTYLERAKTALEERADYADYTDSNEMRARFGRAATLVEQALARLEA